ncbi:YihY/virulence factor BrkB family protein [Paracoccus sp. MBLB3053]|uniref:YihY/virulence factor BrkB family protein n=1 Tax=Paracoccus aurantius TaxID=3073814 RepID=A0ABU2HY95_9RHOB|nr:YihY/virulence factor BrkB family protein [Paracoccus sp. MBLB3053]MDS9470039.1 YihY/virulence factor BrkB family protein [Paracoccus sp. MBLB3053]
MAGRARSGPSPAGLRAGSPRDIPPPGWKQILLRVRREIAKDHVSVVSAGVAFYGLIALFPAIAALIGLSGFFLDPSDLAGELARLSASLPPDAASIIENQVVAVTGGSGTGSGLVAVSGLALAIYGAMKGVLTLIEGLNIAYDEEEKRGIFRLYLTALALTLAILLGFLATLALAIVLPSIVHLLPLASQFEWAVPAISWIVLGLSSMLGLALIYRFGPSREPARWGWISPGAVVATLVWIGGTVGFSVYVQNFGTYTESYGALGGVIILLTWLWLSAFVVLAGAELNAETELQTARDTTTGSPLPMGSRGATKADTPPPAFAEAGVPGAMPDAQSSSQPQPARVSPLLLLTGVLLWEVLRKRKRDAGGV